VLDRVSAIEASFPDARASSRRSSRTRTSRARGSRRELPTRGGEADPLIESVLERASFAGATIAKILCAGARLRGAVLVGADLRGCDLTDCDLGEAQPRRCDRGALLAARREPRGGRPDRLPRSSSRTCAVRDSPPHARAARGLRGCELADAIFDRRTCARPDLFWTAPRPTCSRARTP
jgi:hypothetical protein